MKSIFYGASGKIVRRIVLFLMDLALVYIALRLAVLMRYEGAVSNRIFNRIMNRLPAMLMCYSACALLGGVYDIIWKYATSREVLRLGGVYTVAAAVTIWLNRLLNWRISRPVLGMTGVFMFLLAVFARTLWRLVRERMKHTQKLRKARILIVGAGEGGAYAVKVCQQNRANLGTPVAFADDNPLKRKMRVGGIPVCGSIREIPEIVKVKNIDEIIVAVPGTHGERLTEIISICKSTRCRIRILSNPNDIGNQNPNTPVFRELNTRDFLSRAEVALDMDMIRGYLEDKVVLVTGGGGSIGSEICRQILRFKPRKLLIFDIYENCAYELECELKQKYGKDCPIEVLIGSVRDKKRLDDVFEAYAPTVVFHAAAHKHVPLMEMCPGEAVKNNVFGTRNLLQSASEHGVERFVQLSTDKAVNPTNVMGATKRITEMLIQTYARTTGMKCMAVRFGNVLGSHGSVIPLFEAQIRKGGPVTLTHPDITRYFMTIPEAAQLVLQAGGIADSGAIYVLDMGEPVKIMDLAKKLIRFYGYEPGVDMEIKITELRPGEKLHEELMMPKESAGMTRTAHNKIFVAPPVDLDIPGFEARLEQLRQASCADDSQRIVDMLREIVRTYSPNRDMLQVGSADGQ